MSKSIYDSVWPLRGIIFAIGIAFWIVGILFKGDILTFIFFFIGSGFIVGEFMWGGGRKKA